MPSSFSQAFPPAPTFTEKNIASLQGKVRKDRGIFKEQKSHISQVFIVTGAASGVGFELAKLLAGCGGTVYVAARSKEKVDRAIKSISQANAGKGKLHPLLLDLANFSSIKPAVNEFLDKESRLDVLVHNAGLMTPPAGSKNSKVFELETLWLHPRLTRCLGHRFGNGNQLSRALPLESPFGAHSRSDSTVRISQS